MKKILILMGRYLPGHKDGGPLRTIVNVTDALGDEYEFYIGCLDRDHGDVQAYSNIHRNSWNQVGKAKVWYVEPGGFTNELILKLVKGKDLVYLCSFYDNYGYKTLLLKKRHMISCPVVLASMGVFSKGALAQKTLKKKLFISGCKLIGLFKNITWSVTSELEADDVKQTIGKRIRYVVAEDLPRTNVPGISQKNTRFSVSFLSRINPMKNLLGAIQMMQKVETDVDFYIYGPDEDAKYWKQCRWELERLPENVHWFYQGDVPSEEVQAYLSQHDVFLFPTLGENYGHVIFEALSVGCIPVISDQTPWNVIQEEKAGYVLPLCEPQKFADSVDHIAMMSPDKRRKMQEKCVKIALKKVETNRKETGYRIIFG